MAVLPLLMDDFKIQVPEWARTASRDELKRRFRELRGQTWVANSLPVADLKDEPLNAVVVKMSITYPNTTLPRHKHRMWNWQVTTPGFKGSWDHRIGTSFVRAPGGELVLRAGEEIASDNPLSTEDFLGGKMRYVVNFHDRVIDYEDDFGRETGLAQVLDGRLVGPHSYELRLGFDGRGEPEDSWWEGTTFSDVKMTLYTGTDLFEYEDGDGDTKPVPDDPSDDVPGWERTDRAELIELARAYLHGGVMAGITEGGSREVAHAHADFVGTFWKSLLGHLPEEES